MTIDTGFVRHAGQPFPAVFLPGFPQIALKPDQIFPMGGGDVFQVEEFHFVRCRVMLPGKKMRVLWNHQAPANQQLPEFATLWDLGLIMAK